MTVVFDAYVPGRSFLHSLDPRVKLWAILLALVALFMLPAVWQQAVVLVMIQGILLSAGVPWRSLLGLWRRLAILLVLILLLQPWVAPSGRILWSWGPLSLTTGGLVNALYATARLANLAFVVALLLYTTSHDALVLAFVKLGMPFHWGVTLSLTLRFLPAIQDLFHIIRDAQAARGWIPKGSIFRRLRDYIPILVAVIIGTLRMSDQLTLALAARGLAYSQQRTRWHDLRMRPADWMVFGLLTVAFGLLSWWRIHGS